MNKPKVVVIGGGHGNSVVLSSLADRDYDLSTVVSMADNGGTNGMLRKQYGASAVSDIRQCLCALSDSKELCNLFSYRFGVGSVAGHSLGSMFLAAGELMTGSLMESIELAKQTLGVTAHIYPVTLSKPQLMYSNGNQKIVGVYEIANIALSSKPKLSLEPKSQIYQPAKDVIMKADFVIIAPGNFYCSIAQALIVNGMAEALAATKAKVIFVTNLLNIKGHTDGFKVGDYIKEVDRLLGKKIVDYVVYNKSPIKHTELRSNESPVLFEPFDDNISCLGGELVGANTVKADPNDKIAAIRSQFRHNKQHLADLLTKIIR